MSDPLIIGSNGYVARIDPATGQELWRTTLLPGLFSGTVGADVSVLLRGDSIFAGARGHLFCLDLASGKISWHNELKGMGYNDVAIAMEGISIQYLAKVQRCNSGST